MENVIERKTISVCKKSRNSKWDGGQPRVTTAGMKEVVEIYKDEKGIKRSRTKYI